MPRVITIDIETIPAAAQSICQPGPEPTEEHLRTSLSGDFGRILCIGFIDEGRGDGQIRRGCFGWSRRENGFRGDERELLTNFWELLRGFRPQQDRIVGHNIFDFDLKFIYKRSIINGVRPTVDLSFARYRAQPIFDTMHEWERWSYRDRISLDRLAHVLGLPSSKTDGVDGSKVFELYEAGAHQEIRDYCLRDVTLTREIYRRMIFADHPMDAHSPFSKITHSASSAASPAIPGRLAA